GALTPSVELVAFEGQSADTFCLGMDLRGLGTRSSTSEDAPEAGLRAIGDALLAVHQCSAPTVAVVRGRAIGGGVGIAAACDWVIAEEGATFALPEMLWG